MAYLDSAQERIADLASAEFERFVEGVRVGTVFAHDAKAHGRWRRSRRRAPAVTSGLDGLERAVASLAATHPQYVVMGA